MDDLRFGSAVRALRIQRSWRQRDLAARAGVSASLVSRLERGHLETLTLAAIRRVSACLEMRVDLMPRWRGGELDRVLAARHAALAETVVADLTSRGWQVRPEVTFSIWGERGSIDLLAYHAARQVVLVVELKTELYDPHGLIAQVDRYRRHVPGIARSSGWSPTIVGTWVVFEERGRNRRRAASHRALLGAAFPADGRRMAAWLRDPRGAIAALSFRPVPSRHGSGRQRVRIRVIPGGPRSAT